MKERLGYRNWRTRKTRKLDGAVGPFSVWKYYTLEIIEGDIVSKDEMGCRIHATPTKKQQGRLTEGLGYQLTVTRQPTEARSNE